MYRFVLLTLIFVSIVSPTLAQNTDDLSLWIAYVAKRGDIEDIYITNGAGTTTYNLTNARSRDWHPSWSPDGTQIAFNSDRSGQTDIWIMEGNGKNARNLTNSPSSDTSPDWSPVSNEIAFISDRDGALDLYTIQVDNGKVTRITNDGITKSDPTWSPDGTHIVYWTSQNDLVQLQSVNIATGEVTMIRADGQSLWPSYSNADDRIAIFSNEQGSYDILQFDPSNGEVVNLTNSPSNDARPAYSADGNRLAFMSDRDGNVEIYVMDADGLNVRRLTDNAGDDTSPDWQPVSADIDFSDVALGLNANQVIGDPNPNEQTILGRGMREVFAPETASIDDLFRIRLEITLDDANLDNAISNDDSDDLRDSGNINVYRYMGARLTGFHLDRFDIMPDYNGYVLEINEDDVNFWEWYLLPKGMMAAGRNFLAVEIYLPITEEDGSVVRTVIETITFDVTLSTNEVEDPWIIDVDAEPTKGLSVIISEEDLLSLVFSSDADVSDLSIGNADQVFPIPNDFAILTHQDFQLESGSCLNYLMADRSPIYPRACGGNTPIFELHPSDVFWFSDGRSVNDVVLRWNEDLLICDASRRRCDF